MIIDYYTEKENEEWKAIHEKYELVKRHFTEDVDLRGNASFEAEFNAALDEFAKKVEASRIAAIADDPKKILSAIKWQAEQTVENFVSGQIAAEYLNKRTEYMDAIRAAGKEADKLKEQLRMPSIKKIGDRIRATPILEAKDALALIEDNITGLRAALDKFKERQAVSKLVSGVLKESPYVFFADETETAPTLTRPPLSKFETYGLMNDKTALQLLQSETFRQELNGQLSFLWDIDQSPQNKEPVPVSIALQYEGTETKLSRKMTAFDEEVYNAVSTACFYNKRNYPGRPLLITPQEIWRMMNGKTDNSWSPSPKQIAKVCASLDKMRFTRVMIDITAEIKANYIAINDERLKNGTFDTYLLKADKVEFATEKGAVLSGYKIDDEPILYTYNEAKKHILWVPFHLLDTSARTGNTGETVEIRGYLLRQIQLMKNGYRDSKRILYATIYEATGLPSPEVRIDRGKYKTEEVYRATVKKEAKKDRDKIAAILDAWTLPKRITGKDPYFAGYKPVKKGKEFVGVDIAITDKDAEKLGIETPKK